MSKQMTFTHLSAEVIESAPTMCEMCPSDSAIANISSVTVNELDGCTNVYLCTEHVNELLHAKAG